MRLDGITVLPSGKALAGNMGARTLRDHIGSQQEVRPDLVDEEGRWTRVVIDEWRSWQHPASAPMVRL